MNVMIIEDVESTAILERAFLRSLGIESEIFLDPEDALISLEKTMYHGAVVDIVLPKIPGFDVIDRIRLVQPEIPVMIVSGVSDPDNLMECYKRTPFVCAKPIQARSFRSVAVDWIDSIASIYGVTQSA